MNIHKLTRVLKRKIKRTIKKDTNAIKWGIIGTGYMAEVFSSTIDGNRAGLVAAVASRSMERAKKFASKHGNCKAYENYQDLVNDCTIDIVYIATPVEQHYDNIKMCLYSNKNVLCEKPIVMTLEQLKELKEIAISRGCFLMEGMWMKCLPTYQKALEWINEGKIGEVKLIRADFYKKEIIDINKGIHKKESCGVLRDFGVYAISFPLGFMNNRPIVQYSTSITSSFGVDSDWMIHMFDGKIQAYINISSNFASSSKSAVIGTEGYIEWNSPFNRTNIITLYDKYRKKITQQVYQYDYDGFEYEVNEAQNCIRLDLKESVLTPMNQSEFSISIIDELLKKYGSK